MLNVLKKKKKQGAQETLGVSYYRLLIVVMGSWVLASVQIH